MMRVPNPGRRARLLTLAYGLALFWWFSLEDLAVWPVTLFGIGLATLIVVYTLSGKIGGKIVAAAYVPALGGLIGSLIGIGSSVAIAGLMFFKNAQHGHLYPDYPVEMMLAMLQRAPSWAIAGGLLGLSLGLGWRAWGEYTVKT